MPGGVRVDLRNLALELRLVDKRFAASVRRQVRAAVIEAGAAVLAKVRAEAEAQGMPNAAAATTLRTSFATTRATGITVATSARRAREARPLEMGNAGGDPSTLRHPVFGKAWTSMPTRPYFFRGAELATPETEAALSAAIDKAVREAGFH